MGQRTCQGDMHEALQYHKGVMKILCAAHEYTHVYIYVLPRMPVFRERMLETARRGYSGATELASEMVRRFDLDYRTAHEIVNEFVRASERDGIPALEADGALFENACEQVLSRKLDLSEKRLREILDPVNVVRAMTSQGGSSPAEGARMLKLRQEALAEHRGRHEARITKLEKARTRLEADLREIARSTN
jgi:argininosuccinate lyase